MRILVIEDEPKIAAAVEGALAGEGYGVDVARSGEEGFFLASAGTVDLILLDLQLPGRDGLEILTALRRQGTSTPVLVVTARDAIESRVQGLDLGADDYLVKPFALPELLARVRALLRRGRPDQALRLKVTDLELDLLTRRVLRAGRPIDLTAREFELLEYLMRHHRQLVSREMLAQDVWRETGRLTPLDNVIDVHISHLRRKIDRGFEPRLLHTVRGVGFLLQEEEP